MTNRKNDIDARLGRRARTRLTRVVVLALAGPLMAGSLAYAAGVEPVRRRVDEFLKGTAGLFRKAESSAGDFHLSPNPSGQGVLVMPLDDRGPRAAAGHPAQESGNAKEKSPPPGEPKKKSERGGREAETHLTGDSKEPITKSDESKDSDSGSISHSGSSDEGEESSGQDGSDSDDDRSGSNSGSDGSEGSGGSDDDRSGSDSDHSDSGSGED